MDIKILGSGCHDCLRLERLVGQVLAELGLGGKCATDRGCSPDCPLMTGPPGPVINGQLVAEQHLPAKQECAV